MISSAQLACLLIRIRRSTISFPFEYNFESYLWYIDLEYELVHNFGNFTALSMKVTWFHGLLGCDTFCNLPDLAYNTIVY